MMPPIVTVITDLFFAVKVQAAAKRQSIPLVSASSAAAAMTLLRQGASLCIVDLNCRELDPVALVREIKADPALRPIPVIGFVSHVQTDRRQEAIDAGCDQVLARSAFSSRTAEILSAALRSNETA